MSHTIQLPDEVYEAIAAYASRHSQTAEEAISAWAANVSRQPRTEVIEGYIYDPAEDSLAEFLGKGELTDPTAIRRHDEVIAEEALDAHDE